MDRKRDIMKQIEALTKEFRKHDLAALRDEKAENEAYLLASECDYSHQIQTNIFPIFAVLLTAVLFLFGQRLNPQALESYSLAIFIIIVVLLVIWVFLTEAAYRKVSDNKFKYGLNLSVIRKVIEEKESGQHYR
jgi:hypothetical protein